MSELLADVAEQALADGMRLVTADDYQVGFDLFGLDQNARPHGAGIGAVHLGSRLYSKLGQAVGNLAAERVSFSDGLRFQDLLGTNSSLPEVEHRHRRRKRAGQSGDDREQLFRVLLFVDRYENVLELRTYLTSRGTVTEPIPRSTIMAAPTTRSRTRSLVK